MLAEYSTNDNPLNQVVVWDKIIERQSDALLHEDNVFVKYALIDQTTMQRNSSVSLRLVWDHMPLTGRLFMESDSSGAYFQLPGVYK